MQSSTGVQSSLRAKKHCLFGLPLRLCYVQQAARDVHCLQAQILSVHQPQLRQAAAQEYTFTANYGLYLLVLPVRIPYITAMMCFK